MTKSKAPEKRGGLDRRVRLQIGTLPWAASTRNLPEVRLTTSYTKCLKYYQFHSVHEGLPVLWHEQATVLIKCSQWCWPLAYLMSMLCVQPTQRHYTKLPAWCWQEHTYYGCHLLSETRIFIWTWVKMFILELKWPARNISCSLSVCASSTKLTIVTSWIKRPPSLLAQVSLQSHTSSNRTFHGPFLQVMKVRKAFKMDKPHKVVLVGKRSL